MPRETYELRAAPTGPRFVGSPQQIIDKVLYERELFGHDRFLAQVDLEGRLGSQPKKRWAVPLTAREGVSFEIKSAFDLGAIAKAFPTLLPSLSARSEERLFERHTLVCSSNGTTRTESRSGSHEPVACALSNTKLGAVYLDAKDRTYVHFGPEQLPAMGLSAELQKQLAWSVRDQLDGYILGVRGLVSLDVVMTQLFRCPPRRRCIGARSLRA